MSFYIAKDLVQTDHAYLYRGNVPDFDKDTKRFACTYNCTRLCVLESNINPGSVIEVKLTKVGNTLEYNK